MSLRAEGGTPPQAVPILGHDPWDEAIGIHPVEHILESVSHRAIETGLQKKTLTDAVEPF